MALAKHMYANMVSPTFFTDKMLLSIATEMIMFALQCLVRSYNNPFLSFEARASHSRIGFICFICAFGYLTIFPMPF